MFKQIFFSKTRVLILLLFLVSFFHFNYIPEIIRMSYDKKMFYAIVIFLTLGFIGKSNKKNTIFDRVIKITFVSILICAIANCISCFIFRHQPLWVTFFHWSPIFLLYLYYPFRTLNFSVKTWESILFTLFCIEMVVEIIQNLFPDALLFQMTSGNVKFLFERRVRVYGCSILYIGQLFVLNKGLINRNGSWRYWLLYITSFCLMILSGFRIVLFASVVSSFIMVLRIKKMKIRTTIVIIISVLCLYGVTQTNFFQSHLSEIVERQENTSFYDNDNVRMVTLEYYLNNYFVNPYEWLFGSGMVKRIVDSGAGPDDIVKTNLYESKYSRDVSMTSARYHIYPVDWGLLGLSWEAGVPAILILIVLQFYLMFHKLDNKYLYISSWGLFALIISAFGGSYYSSPNLLYTAILLVIFNEVSRDNFGIMDSKKNM